MKPGKFSADAVPGGTRARGFGHHPDGRPIVPPRDEDIANRASNDNRQAPWPRQSGRLGMGGWFTLFVLGGFLVAAASYAIYAWNSLSGVSVSGAGWLFLGLGIVTTVLVGAGLMALVFYSSRHDYDR